MTDKIMRLQWARELHAEAHRLRKRSVRRTATERLMWIHLFVWAGWTS